MELDLGISSTRLLARCGTGLKTGRLVGPILVCDKLGRQKIVNNESVSPIRPRLRSVLGSL